MGNALRFLCAQCCSPSTESDSADHPGVTAANVSVSALAHDLFNFEITNKVPQDLSKQVASSKKTQRIWYKKLSTARRESRPPPKTPEEASRLVVETLSRHRKADIEGLLAYYELPLPHTVVDLTSAVPPSQDSQKQGLKFELHTLPVDGRAVADGDTLNVYDSTRDPPESAVVPRDVQMEASERSNARARRNYDRADELHRQIINAGYRGIDAPENKMPFGKKAKEELTKVVQDKCLRVLVFDEDQYGRLVGDVYSNGIFVQEVMLKKGLAWHYKHYAHRQWEKEARAKKVGLWSSVNPEMPWEWRKDRREGR